MERVIVRNRSRVYNAVYFVLFIVITCVSHAQTPDFRFRSDTLVSVVEGKVNSWVDEIAGGLSLLQTSVVARPSYSLNDVGDSVLHYVESDKFLTLNSDINPASLCVILKLEEFPGYARIIDRNVGNDCGLHLRSAGIEARFQDDNSLRTIFGTPDVDNYISVSVVISDTENEAFGRVNLESTILGQNRTWLSGSYQLGRNGLSFNGEVLELSIFNSVLSEEQLSAYELDRMNHYGPPPLLSITDSIYTDDFCSINLSPGTKYIDYLWNTESVEDTISISEEGWYFVTVKDIFGRVRTDSVYVSYPGEFIQAFPLCLSQDSLWDTGLSESDGFSFVWDTPSPNSGSSVLIDEPGMYNVVITDSEGCTREASVEVSQDDFPIIASLGPDIELCSGNSISLISGAESAQSYLWNDIPGEAELLIESSGTYWVEAVNENGCIAQDTIEVTVIGEAPVSFFGFTNPCFGESVQFVDGSIAPPGETITVYNWDFDDGMGSDQASPAHSFALIDTFNVTLQIETAVGCTDEYSETIIIRPIPVAAFGFSSLCHDQEVLFSDTSSISAGAIESSQWTFNESDILDGSMVSYFFDEPGEYTAQLISISDFGCRDTLEQVLTVNGSPVSSFIAETVCLGAPTLFQADPDETLSGPVNQYLWQFDSFTSIFETTTFTYQSSGAFEVSLTVTSALGCSDDTTAIVFVSEDPLVGFSYGIACVGQPIQFIDTSFVLSGDIVSGRTWFFANVDESDEESPFYTFDFPGVFDVALDVQTVAGCSAQIEEQIEVSALPLSLFSIEPNIGSPPFTPEISNLSEGAQDYLWTFDLGETSMNSDPTHTFTDSGLVLVDLVVVNSEGCTDLSSQPIFLTEPIDDLVLLDVEYDLIDGFLSPTLSIRNVGNYDVEEFIIAVAITNGSVIQELWTGLLPRNGSLLYTMNSSIYYDERVSLPFFCTKLFPIAARVDADWSNNEICKEIGNVGDEVFILHPSPNPADEVLSFSFVNAGRSDITAELIDMYGRLIVTEQYISDDGLVQKFDLYVGNISPGRYLLRLGQGIMVETYKIQILRE